MMPVLAANKSKTEAVPTTANSTGRPPHIAPSLEMNRSVSCNLIGSGNKAIEKRDSNGEVSRIEITTTNIPLEAVERIGARIAGLSWLILSRPENANHRSEERRVG